MRNRLSSLFVVFILSFPVILFTSCDHHENEWEEEEESGARLSSADKQLSNWYWQKGYPDPTDLSNKYLRAWEQYLELKKNSVSNDPRMRTTVATTWTAIGPKVFGGRVLSIAINPVAGASGSNTMYVGSASGGIWRSYTNGLGATAWQPVSTGFPVLGVASIVYHPTDTSTILAGTGEVYRYQTLTNGANSTSQVGNIGRNVWKARGTYGIGILKTTNAGATWTNVMPKVSSDLFAVQKIKYDPTNSNTVYACTTDGLYRSTNGGDSWTRIWVADYVNDIVINPSNNQQIVVAAGNADNTSKGLWRSTDGGTTFTKITTTVPTSYATFKGYATLNIAGTNTIFAAFGDGDTNGDASYGENEIYRSTDFGATWTVITNSNHSQFQAWFAHCIAPYPGSTTKFFIAGVDRYVLTISGSTGTRTGVGNGAATMSSYITPGSQEGGTTYVHDDVHDIQFLPGSSTTAYFCTDGGVFRTTNAGASPVTNISFASCNGGLQVQQFYPTVAQSQSNANLIMGGLQDNNVVRYNGTGWARIIAGDGGPVVFKPGDETLVLGSRDTRAVYQSTNSGASFPTTVLAYLGTVPIGNDDRTSFMSPIIVSPANPNRWYVASDNLHVSTLSGTTFGIFSNNDASGIPQTSYISAKNKTGLAMGISSTDANRLYISVSPFAQNVTTSTESVYYNPPAQIRKTTNGGTSFTTVSSGLPDRLYTDIAVSPTYHDSVFVTLGGFGTTHIYVTGDGGSTWAARGSGLPDVPFNTIMFDPVDPKILYAGCDFGVYVSPDRGANWYDFNGGLWDATYVIDLVPAPGGKIRAFTHGKGIFETSLWNGIVTLPVTLRSFTGENRGAVNELNWKVEQEINLKHYELQRSTDGLNFKTIYTAAAGNNWNPSSYRYNDMIASVPSVQLYYRLRIVDEDGTFRYSDIVTLKSKLDFRLDVLGNPFRNQIQLRYSTQQTTEIQLSLYDIQGKLMLRDKLIARTGTAVHTVSGVSYFPPGVYMLHAEGEKVKTVMRLVKQ